MNNGKLSLRYEKINITVYYIDLYPNSVKFILDYKAFVEEMKKYEKNTVGLKAGYFEIANNKFFELYQSFSLQLILSGLEYETIFYETMKFFYVYVKLTRQVEQANLFTGDGQYLWV